MFGGQEPLRAEAQQIIQPRSSSEADARAENNRRTVHFETDRIVIVRRVSGVSMRVTMPVAKYDGVGVLMPNFAEGYRAFRVALVHADPDLSVTLYEGADPAMIDAALAEWSSFFKLPVIGGASAPAVSEHDTPATVAVGDRSPQRRRGGTLAKRRPRLYGRRRVGDAERMTLVHRGEREIIART